MAVIVNIAQYDSVPDVVAPAGSPSIGAVVQFPGPLIVAANVSVNGTADVSWNAAARYAILSIIAPSTSVIYADSAATQSPALAVGEGQAILDTWALIRRDSQAYILLREHA